MAALAQLGSNALRVGAHPGAESIHQLRVAVRRLRGTLSTFKPVIDDSQVEAIKIELKWLGRELDEARNLDVFITGALRRAKGDAPMPRPLAAFGRRLRAARKAAYARARDAAAGARFRTLLLDAVQWVEVGPWTRARGAAAKLRKAPAGDLAAKALARPRRRIRKDGADLAGISRHRRHRVRIQAKILRYACEAFAPLIEDHPKRAAVFIDGLKDLQEVLGDINDIVCGETLIEEMATPELAQGLIQSERARETRLIAAAQDALDTFAEARRFWRQ
jgi:CHAD domain-containing protein